MNTSSKSVFYDGQSSVPKTIDIFLDSNKGQISFQIESKSIENEDEASFPIVSETYTWLINDIEFEHRSTALFLQHGENPIQTIKITDAASIATINQFRKASGQLSWYQTLLQKPLQFHVFLALFLLAIIGLSYVYMLPWVAEKSVALIPESYDDALGETFVDENSLFGDSQIQKTKLLNDFASGLQLNNKKKLNFKVIDSEIMNAYALPDGTIVVYTGILKEMKSYDELVGLLGHEVAHVNNRHSMKMLCRNLSGYLFISTVLGDVNGVMAILGDNVNTLQSLSFSREFEREADEEGFAIVSENQVNPKGMVTLFQRLEKEHSIDMPEFLSTHPVTKDRIQSIKKMIASKNHVVQDNSSLKILFEKLKK
ncbi:M48 family metallopeptidase [Flavobacterium sp. RSSA_27]|uniref:M48 family metallopeptidase n=1 Tax=Flavobacterium sp. RSSA_27 TaxID=3447667 RepID=UPI003F3A6B49